MRRSIIRTILTRPIILSAGCASTQYNKDYFYWMGRQSMMNDNFQEAIRILNVLLRFDNDAHEASNDEKSKRPIKRQHDI